MSGMRCRSCGRKGSCNCGSRIADCGFVIGLAPNSSLRKCGCQVSTGGMTTKELKERTFHFGIRAVRVVECLPKGDIGRTLGQQLLRAATSVGANYRAAARARSRADFIAKMGIVEEECDEALFWMEFLVQLRLVKATRLRDLLKEGDELLAIIVSSINTARRRKGWAKT
jgi:four helix bundle protein